MDHLHQDTVRVAMVLGSATALAAVLAVGTPKLFSGRIAENPLPAVATVTVEPGRLDYPRPGEFLLRGKPVAAPHQLVQTAGFEIMAYQVSVADYAHCVDEGDCRGQNNAARALPDQPVTGVTHMDADAYAEWYSEKTGDAWRLPTDIEWAAAAGERFLEGRRSIAYDPDNPAVAWLGRYEAEASDRAGPDPLPRKLGAFGINDKGLFDIAGNVWEWTSTCYRRTTLADDGVSAAQAIDNCGVHVVEGRHRTYISDFVSDAKAGGCSAGTPPDNLGFRLVREQATIFDRARRFLRNLASDISIWQPKAQFHA